MKYVALVSGGKDSIYSILQCQRQGHELIACVHLGRPVNETEESFMYQTAASEAVQIQIEECLGVPLLLYVRKGTSVNTSLAYEKTENDEVEDLFLALKEAKSQFPEIEAVSAGAILSNYQRLRIESVCGRLQLTSLSYLWRLAPQKELLARMLDDGIDAVLVKVAAPPGLTPGRHLGKTLRSLQGHFLTLHDRFQFHVCGEGGEYESLVVDCPIFRRRLVFDETVLQQSDDGVGTLMIIACHSERKEGWKMPEFKVQSPNTAKAKIEPNLKAPINLGGILLPHVRRVNSGFWSISEILSPFVACNEAMSEAELTIQEACAIFDVLKRVLELHNCTPQDVTLVHIYLADISHFALINNHYQELFGVFLPPARVCVGLGTGMLPGGRRVSLDCTVVTGSGAYLRSSAGTNEYAVAAMKDSTKLRQVLHVQSRSHWAPVCVGPYSQANTLWEGLHQMAGQIGLIPASMKLAETWQEQLSQAWKNMAAALDALDGGSLDHSLSATVYVSSSVHREEHYLETVFKLSGEVNQSNGGIVPGEVDNLDLQGGAMGFEDEETMKEVMGDEFDRDTNGPPPILVVVLPEMPVGASAEVEILAASRKAFNCLPVDDCHKKSQSGIVRASFGHQHNYRWDSGNDFGKDECDDPSTSRPSINAWSRSLGCGAAASLLVVASFPHGQTRMHTPGVISAMLDSLIQVSTNGIQTTSYVHVRCYHIVGNDRLGIYDGQELSSAVQLAFGERFGSNCPAISSVPVQYLEVDQVKEPGFCEIRYAWHVLALDPNRLKTELWVHHGRDV